MSEPNVHEQLAGMTIERDAAEAAVARVVDLCNRSGDLDNGLLVWDVLEALGRRE